MTPTMRRTIRCATAGAAGLAAAGFASRCVTRCRQAPGPEEWTGSDWSQQVRDYAYVEGRIRYLDHGSGPALVLLHGMASSWQWWLPVLPELGRRFRVIAIDLPGFGGSDPLTPGWTMADQADAVAALCAHLDVDHPVVLGHSMGGLVALALEAGYPELVQRLVLVGAGGVPMSERHLEIVLAGLRFAQRLVASPRVLRLLARRPGLLRAMLASAMVHPGRLSDALAVQVAPSLAAPAFADSIAASAVAVRHSEQEQVQAPTLLLWGERDRFAPLSSAFQMRARVPHAHLEAIADVGHLPMIEEPERFARLLHRYADPTRPLPGHNPPGRDRHVR